MNIAMKGLRIVMILFLIHGLFSVGSAFAAPLHGNGNTCPDGSSPPCNAGDVTQPATNPTHEPGDCGPGQHDDNGTCVPNGQGGGNDNPCPGGQHQDDSGSCVPNGGGGGNDCQNQGQGSGGEDQGGGKNGCGETQVPPTDVPPTPIPPTPIPPTPIPPTTDPCVVNPQSCVTVTEPPEVTNTPGVTPTQGCEENCVTPTQPAPTETLQPSATPSCEENCVTPTETLQPTATVVCDGDCVTATLVPTTTGTVQASPTAPSVPHENRPPKTGAGDAPNLAFAFSEIFGSIAGLWATARRKRVGIKIVG